jgi:BarA-like signal transduction histidine kinase
VPETKTIDSVLQILNGWRALIAVNTNNNEIETDLHEFMPHHQDLSVHQLHESDAESVLNVSVPFEQEVSVDQLRESDAESVLNVSVPFQQEVSVDQLNESLNLSHLFEPVIPVRGTDVGASEANTVRQQNRGGAISMALAMRFL